VLLRRVSTGLAAVSLTVVGLPAVASAAPPTTPFVASRPASPPSP